MKPIAIAPLLFLPAPHLAQAWLDAPRQVFEDPALVLRAVADFDGDGDADLLVTKGGAAASFHVRYRHLGQFLPGAEILLPPFTGSTLALAGDLTGDGLPEVVLNRQERGDGVHGVVVSPNVGGTMRAPVFVATPGNPVTGVLADRDGDGRLDLGLVCWGSPLIYPHVMSWWSPSGSTLVSAAESTLDDAPSALVAAEVTGDGRPDLIAVSSHDARIFVFESLPSGALGSPTTLSLGTPSGRAVTPGDLDGDGDADLLVSWCAAASPAPLLRVAVVENRGGSLTPGPEQSFEIDALLFHSFESRAGHLADWDLDGDLDFVSVGRNTLWLENRVQNRFALAGSVPMPLPTVLDGGVADLDDDGHPDLAVGSVIDSGAGRLTSRSSAVPRCARLEDLEGDGDLDALDVDRTWINDGAGGFRAEAWRLPTSAPGTSLGDVLALDDFDGDGWRDLLAVQLQGGLVSGTVLMRGTVGGGFTAGVPAVDAGLDLSASAVSLELAAADLDGDGDLDLPAFAAWWENDGAGFFTEHDAAWLAVPVAAADMDGDHDVDLLTYSSLGTTSAIRLQVNLGGGVFASSLLAHETSSANGLSPRAYFVDLDSDGDLDVAFGTTEPSARVLLFENSGGALLAPIALDGQDFAQDTLVFDDVDGDGKLDLIGLPAGRHDEQGGTYCVWRHAAGAFAFDAPLRFFGRPANAAADIDQDGDLDVVGPCTVRGRRFEGAAAGLVRQYGAGTPGSGGIRPLLGATGPLRPGSSTAALRIRRGLGGSFALLRFGAGPANLHSNPSGLVHWIRPPFLPLVTVPLSGAPGAPGEGAAERSLTSFTAPHAGASFWLQALVLDPGVPGGVSATNGLELAFGL